MSAKKIGGVALGLLILAGLYVAVEAGGLEPPASPAPTMVTLQDLFDLLSTSLGGLPATGQTGCWDETGTSIACAGTGHDGETQNGTTITPRFTDNGDGTIRDNLTGLIWLRNANGIGIQTWLDALADSNGLADGMFGLTDGSVAGDWRLPNVRELLSLADYGQSNPSLPPGHPFNGFVPSFYWSSTSYAFDPARALCVEFIQGRESYIPKVNNCNVLPVRGGQ